VSTPRPEVTAPGPWHQPRPREVILDNGLRLLTLDLPGQEVIACRTVVPVSLSEEDPAHEGATAMLARLLDEGAGGLGPEEFALALERHGAVLGAGVVEGGLSVDLDVPARHLAAALALLADALAEPLLPESEVRRVLRNRVAEYDHESSSAPHRAARELIATMWSPRCRASRPTAGRPETIEAIDREVLRARHARVLPAGSTLVVSGNLRGLDVPALVGDTLGRWQATGVAARAVAPEPAPDAARIVLVDRPGSVQSEFAIGCPAPGRSDEQWAAFPVLAYLIGGSPNARIDALLREDKGYTYGIRAAMRPRAVGGSFVVSGSVRREVTAEALTLLLGELDRAREGFAAPELARGVDFITRAQPGRWGTSDAVADEFAALALEGLPLDQPERSMAAMQALVPDDLSSAMARLGVDGWSIVLVADAETVFEPLRASGVGPIQLVRS